MSFFFPTRNEFVTKMNEDDDDESGSDESSEDDDEFKKKAKTKKSTEIEDKCNSKRIRRRKRS